MSDEIQEAMHLQEQYKYQKKCVKALIAESKSKHYRDELRESKGNTSKTWKIVRDIVPGSRNLNSGRNYSDISINVANRFNDFFENVGKNIYDRTQILVQGENVPHFNFSTVTAGVVPASGLSLLTRRLLFSRSKV